MSFGRPRPVFASSQVFCLGLWLFFNTQMHTTLAANDTAPVKSTMRQLGSAIEQLAPFAYDQKVISDPVYQATITEALRAIGGGAGALKSHAGLGQDFLIGGISINADARQALKYYERHAFGGVKKHINSIIDACTNCHTGREATAPASINFMRLVNKEALKPLQRARLLTAGRQFDQAMTAFEQDLAAKDFSWYQFSRDDALLDYLTVGVRVTGELPRVKKTLVAIQAKKELPAYFSVYLATWIESLDRLISTPKLAVPSLVTVKQLMREALQTMSYQTDRAGLVYCLRASGLLRDMLAAKAKLPDEQKSESYYLLGVIEIVAGRSSWLPQTAEYLEAAIRSKPGSSSARKAFALLEEHLIIFAYNDNSEKLVPEELTVRINELRPLAMGTGGKHE